MMNKFEMMAEVMGLSVIKDSEGVFVSEQTRAMYAGWCLRETALVVSLPESPYPDLSKSDYGYKRAVKDCKGAILAAGGAVYE